LKTVPLDEIISILQNYDCDPTTNVNQVGFGSYSANHVIKEKIDLYHKETIFPPKLGYVWELRI
jgi:hypothetical protein